MAGATPLKTCFQIVALFILCAHTILLIRNEGKWVFSFSEVSKTPAPQQPLPEIGNRRLAIATFVDQAEHIFGLYSIRNQMRKFGMHNVSLVTVTKKGFDEAFPTEWKALNEWSDPKDIHVVDRSYIVDKIGPGLWKGTFNKLWLFNLTEFDKVIVLDQDVFIRTNLMHWFDYPTPCAVQANDNIEWNSGAMVITPNTKVFDDLVILLDIRFYIHVRFLGLIQFHRHHV